MVLTKSQPKRSLPAEKLVEDFCPSISPIFFGMSFSVDQRYLRNASLPSLVRAESDALYVVKSICLFALMKFGCCFTSAFCTWTAVCVFSLRLGCCVSGIQCFMIFDIGASVGGSAATDGH
jgi:hypothetical protein